MSAAAFMPAQLARGLYGSQPAVMPTNSLMGGPQNPQQNMPMQNPTMPPNGQMQTQQLPPQPMQNGFQGQQMQMPTMHPQMMPNFGGNSIGRNNMGFMPRSLFALGYNR